MDDLISRADAIEAFDRGRVYHKSGIEEIINSLPSAEAEWIPVSERLPAEGQGVLVTVDYNEYGIKVGSCIYSDGCFHSVLYAFNVIAWQPLPTPYKGSDDECV